MADRLTVEHYIGKCFEKCAQIVLGSRVYQVEENKASQDKRSAQWFLLEVEEHAGLSVRLDPWRRDIYAPLVIEIYIQPWDSSSVMVAPAASAARQDANSSTPSTGGRTLLERWSLGYTAGSTAATGAGSSSRPVVEPAAVYKRLILLIRSLYSYVRVLPAYRMYRACKRHGRELFNTSYTISTAPLPLTHQQQYGSTAAAAGAGSSNRRMQQFVFSPIETMYGVFEMSVEYQPATTVQFLEQTTLLPCQPRIITDYVDGPYARSAPSDRVTRAHSSSSSSIATREDKSSDAGAPAFLRSSQHHAPLVRTSWSSKDIPVVQRGFNPPARSNSLNTAAAAAGATQQQQQQVLSLHRRSLSQGYESAVAAGGAAGFNTGTIVAPHVVPHNIPHVGSHGSSNAGLGSVQTSAAFPGPSSLGKPPLPHSPALTAAAAAHPPHISSSASSAAAAAAVVLPPASPGTPVGSSSRGVGSVLLRSLSANAAAAASAAAAAAAAAAAGIASSAPGQAGAGLTTAAVQQLSRLGSSFSSSTSPLGSTPRVLGFGMHRQQQQQQQKQPMDPQATQQGFHVKSSSNNSSNSSSGLVSSSEHKQAAVLGQQSHSAVQQQQQGHFAACEACSSDTAMAAAAESDLACARISSAPVPIPGRQKGRARSVTDLQQLGALAAAPQEQQQQLQQQGAAALQAQQQRQQLSNSSSLLRVRARQQGQQQVPVASSAPAAPRGMLGQLLSNSSNTSPSVSPPHDTAAAAAADPRAAAAGHQFGAAGDDDVDAILAEQQDSSPAAATAAGRSHAIIIRPQPLQHPYQTAAAAAAAAAGASPSNRVGYSRYASTGSAAAAAYSLGAQPVTPGGPNSLLSCSPQLPFAFTPSAASLGMSIITFPDQQRHLVQGSGGNTVAATARGLGRSRSSNAAGAQGAGSAVGAGTAPGSGSLGTAAVAGSSSDGSSVNAIGTPSPPPHVSCVRDITGLATIRRPSWSSRSSSFDVAASASLPRHLSVSPMGDLLDPALLGCSNTSTHNALSGGHNAFALGGHALSLGRSNLGVAAGMRPAAAAAGTGVVMTPAVVLPGGFGSSDQDVGTAAAAAANSDGGNSRADQAGQDLDSSCDPAAAAAAVAAASGDQPRSGSDSAVGNADVMGQADTAAAEAADAAADISAADQLLLESVMRDESESDILPFAIDAEPYVNSGSSAAGPLPAAAAAARGAGYTVQHELGFQQQQQQGRGARLQMQDHRAIAGGPAAAAAERDVAVGAFVKLIQEASTRQLHRCHHTQQQQQQQTGTSGDLHALLAQESASKDVDHQQQQQQQQQQLMVADALEQVQQMAAQLQVLVFPNGE